MGFQYCPVASITTSVTLSDTSQSASSSNVLGEGPKRADFLVPPPSPLRGPHGYHHLVLRHVETGYPIHQQVHRRHLQLVAV